MTTATDDARTLEARVRRAHLLVATGVLVLCAVVYVVLAATLAGDLPQRVATHFGADGTADGWMSRGAALLVGGLVGVGVPTTLLVAAAAGQWWRGRSARAVTAFVAALGVWLVALFAQLYATQLGPADPASARMEPMALFWALVAALVVGAGVALVLPGPLPQPEPVTPEAMEIGPTDSVSWFGRAHLSQGVLLLVLGLLGLLSVVTVAVGEPWLWVLVLATLVLTLGMLSFTVRVDREGVSWRSALGWPRGRVRLADVTGVAVSEVRAGDFGGYGVRLARGATGLITRGGPALEVRHGARRLVVTVDDAITAASVLEGLRRSGPR